MGRGKTENQGDAKPTRKLLPGFEEEEGEVTAPAVSLPRFSAP